MKARYMIAIWLLAALLAPAAWPSVSAATESAQDSDLSVDPVIRVFPVTTLGTDSEPATFTVTNHDSTNTRTLGALSLSGPNADEFALVTGSDTCTGATLAADGGKCTVEVKFHPVTRGTKGANLLILSDDSETSTLTAFVTNHEATICEARRRMPPVLSEVDIPEAMLAGETYTLTWSQEGYDASDTSNIVLFDCAGAGESTCGDHYEDNTRFAASGDLEPISTPTGQWQYSGVPTHLFNYSWDFTVPETRAGGGAWEAGGSQIVVRFYRKNEIDLARNSRSMSLLIPGNLSDEYYDTAGRRIVKKIYP